MWRRAPTARLRRNGGAAARRGPAGRTRRGPAGPPAGCGWRRGCGPRPTRPARARRPPGSPRRAGDAPPRPRPRARSRRRSPLVRAGEDLGLLRPPRLGADDGALQHLVGEERAFEARRTDGDAEALEDGPRIDT